MKKITIYIAMALLCLNIQVKAQDNKAVDVTLKGIQIGQKVPDVNITGLHNYRDANGKPATTAKISDFKGKLLILDFWATWCSPCIAMIPKMDSLQKVFGDKIQFLSVTYQSDKEVLPFLEKLEKQQGKHYDLPIVTGDKSLIAMFPHVYLPHYVWVNGKESVIAFTGHEEVTKENIENYLSGKLSLKNKNDLKLAYDNKRPLLLNGNGGNGENLIYHSVLTSYTPGLAGGYSFGKLDKTSNLPRKISCWNKPLSHLYRIAYQQDTLRLADNRIIIEVSNSDKMQTNAIGEDFIKWRSANAVCYELIVPAFQAADIFNIMQQDLLRLFPKYRAKLERRNTPCLVLVKTSKRDKIKTTGGTPFGKVSSNSFVAKNSSLGYLISQLGMIYLSKYPHPIIDRTGYMNKVDLEFQANMTSVKEINKALEPYELAFVEKNAILEMLIISDAKPEML